MYKPKLRKKNNSLSFRVKGIGEKNKDFILMIFEGDFFHWDSQTTQHINTPKIKEIISGSRIPYLFIRITFSCLLNL
jgi:hypothetical protein